MSMITCPRCQKAVESLAEVPTELQLRLLDVSLSDSLFTNSCSECLKGLKRLVTNPGEAKLKQSSADSQKQNLWSSRADFLKNARQALAENHWANASKYFQSYILALETAFDAKPGSLTPDIFRSMNKIEEMKTIVLVYWELMVIHDGKDEKLVSGFGQQLGVFGKCSPLKMTVLEKIKEYESKAVYKKHFRRVDKELRGEKGFFSIFKAS